VDRGHTLFLASPIRALRPHGQPDLAAGLSGGVFWPAKAWDRGAASGSVGEMDGWRRCLPCVAQAALRKLPRVAVRVVRAPCATKKGEGNDMRNRHHNYSSGQHRTLATSLAAALLASVAPVQALEFDILDIPVKLDNLVTVGGVMRMQDRDSSLIMKSNLNPGICVRRTSGNSEAGANPNGGSRPGGSGNNSNRYAGNACTTTNGTTPGTPSAANLAFVAAPGSYNSGGDDGNLNFDKGDIVHATAKITTDLSFNIADFNFFVRGTGLFDANYSDDFQFFHPDTTFVPRNRPLSQEAVDRVGKNYEVLDYFVSRVFELGDRQVAVKLGNQVLNWGESTALIPNSLNSINPANQALLRVPGFDFKELAQPIGMLFVNTELFWGINLEAFYQYEWKPVVVDPVGTFFSQSDTLGEGGFYAMLGQGKAPEDPLNLYQANQNGDDGFSLLGSTSGRTAYRDFEEEKRRLPDDGGQYGAAFKYFAEDLNGGTEFGVYYVNYHARVPSVSVFAAEAGCVPSPGLTPVDNLAALAVACQITPTGSTITAGGVPRPQVRAANEPAPLDTLRLIVEYPEDIQMFGLSFNTTVAGWALSGEYSYRPNLPLQIQTTDLVFAGLNPALPEADYDVGANTIPGRRNFFPDFTSVYRGVRNADGQFGYSPGAYIRGWEDMKVGQAQFTLLKTIGGDNLFGASQIVIILEGGHTHVFDFPDLSELQFNGAGTDTHISSSADGSVGLNPLDLRTNPNNPYTNRSRPATRANPTATDPKGFGDQHSYGYRAIALTRYDDAMFGANLEILTAMFHDLEGVSPGLGQNFVEGRKNILAGLRFDYLSQWNGEIRYTWFTGGGLRDSLRDRDNLLLFVGYQF
jgi:hypothetical protein